MPALISARVRKPSLFESKVSKLARVAVLVSSSDSRLSPSLSRVSPGGGATENGAFSISGIFSCATNLAESANTAPPLEWSQ